MHVSALQLILCTSESHAFKWQNLEVLGQNGQVLRTLRNALAREVVSSLLSQYLCEGKGVGHVADQNLPQLPIEVSTLDPIQMCIHPVDPVKKTRRVADGCRGAQAFS